MFILCLPLFDVYLHDYSILFLDFLRNFQIELHNSESALRKLENEKEGFEFRNSQLVKRVESLQNEIDNVKQSSVKVIIFGLNFSLKLLCRIFRSISEFLPSETRIIVSKECACRTFD